MWNLSDFETNTAVIKEDGSCISYKKLKEDGEALHGFIKERRLIFVLCRQQYGSIMGYVSFLNHKQVPLLLDADLDRQFLWNLIAQYKPDYLWAPKEQAAELCFANGYCNVTSIEDYGLIKTPFSKMYPLYKDLALLLITSGSTGSPKLVRQSYENIRANTQAISEYLSLTEEERPITTLPMNYTYGLSIINTHLSVGASIILTEKGIMQRAFWEQMERHQATSLAGVPYTYEMLDKLRFFQRSLPSLRTMTQAGGKLNPDLHKKFAQYAQQEGKEFVVMYGATEATARMGYLPSQKALEKCGSMGIAIPGGKFYLTDDGGQVIHAPNVTGELIYEGPNVTLGYAQSGEDLRKGDERHGTYRTGDMAMRDEDGFYYITGRKKRFLKMFGNRINLDEVEQLVKAVLDHADCACAGTDDNLYLFVTEGNKAEAVKKFVVEKTGFHHSAIHVQTIDQIPKNNSGKTLYAALERYYD